MTASRKKRFAPLLRKLWIGAALSLTVFAASHASAAIVYSDRTSFEATLVVSITDDYSAPGYAAGNILDQANFDIHSDASMSAVLGETQYTSTGISNRNIIVNQAANPLYCAGCNGSFLLDFTATSVGSAVGVFGVGLDVPSVEGTFGTVAFVTFGDGSTENFAIPAAPTSGFAFWGITDMLMISTIHFGLLDGGINTENSIQRMAMDNLTIGAAQAPNEIPLPAAFPLFIAGLIGLRLAARKKKVGAF